MKNGLSPLKDCISEVHHAGVDNAKDVDVVMLMYNLIECSK